jgi:flagellar hook-basal body complex protein FliE
MVEGINPVSADLRLAQLLGDNDFLAQAPAVPAAPPAAAPAAVSGVSFTGSPFEDMLAKAIESLNKVSQTELYANQLVDKYVRGQAELQDVMVAQSKMSIMVQLAVTSVNAAVNTFKEITQMQI